MNLVQSIPLADSWDMHGDFGTGWWLGMVLFWTVIILGFVWLVRNGFGGPPGRRKETPTEILERRFAEGAISVDDYEQRREILARGARGDPGASAEPE